MITVARPVEVLLIHVQLIFTFVLLTGCQPSRNSGPDDRGARDTLELLADGELQYDKSIAFLKLSQIKPPPTLPPPATKSDDTSDRA